jgi:hypothetical protein
MITLCDRAFNRVAQEGVGRVSGYKWVHKAAQDAYASNVDFEWVNERIGGYDGMKPVLALACRLSGKMSR